MQDIDVFVDENAAAYEIVAFARGESSIYYDEITGQCPDERGGWWMLTKRASSFALYRGEAGCPLCGTDDFDNWFDTDEESITRDQAVRFVEEGGYEPAIEVSFETMRQFCDERTVGVILPRSFFVTENRWDEWPSRDKAAEAITEAVGAEMGWPPPRQEYEDEPASLARPASGMRNGHPLTESLIDVLRIFTIGSGMIAGLVSLLLFVGLSWWTILISVVLGLAGLVALLVSLGTLVDMFEDLRNPTRVQGVARKIAPDPAHSKDEGPRQLVMVGQTFNVDYPIWDWLNDGDRISLLHWPRTGRVIHVNKLHS